MATGGTSTRPALRVSAGWLFGLLGVAVVALVVLVGTLRGGLIDLQVYRAGGAAWLQGLALYEGFPGELDTLVPLPFVYPPLAAVLFSSLTVLPVPVAIGVLTGAGLLALAVTVCLAMPKIAPSPVVFGVLAVAGLVIEPIRETLFFGQINLVLMGLVAVDCLLPRRAGSRYPRGMLIGIAAAIKLTPAIFVLFFLARRQFAPVIIAAATFVVAGGLGALLAPSDSQVFWTSAVFNPNRVGVGYAANQSLLGMLTRLDLSPGVHVLWLALVAGVLALTWRGAVLAHRAGDPVIALLVVATGGLLVSPLSWSHHWIWVVPALAVAWRAASNALVPFTVTALFVIGPHGWLPRHEHRELAWQWWQHLAGNSYLIAALIFLAYRALPRRSVRADLLPQSLGRRGHRVQRGEDAGLPVEHPADHAQPVQRTGLLK